MVVRFPDLGHPRRLQCPPLDLLMGPHDLEPSRTMALRCCDVEAQGLPTRDCSMREGEVCAIMGILASVSPGTDLENLEVAAHPAMDTV